jgi:predicted acetyltransferase
MLRLVEPAPLYKAAILDGVAEMQASGEWDISPEAFAARFDEMLRELAAAKDQATTPPGMVPYEDFWLMEDDSWIGLLTLRLRLTEELLHAGGHIGYVIRPSKRRCGYGTALLRLGLDKACERGLSRVLLTCDETNTGSRKIIEANGGQFENAVVVEGQADKKLRYWISDVLAKRSFNSLGRRTKERAILWCRPIC